MKITLYGAAREVTGSCYCVETAKTRLLVDCGMFQGSAYSDAKNFRDFGFRAADVDAVAVTHAHLDHVGRLPKLVKDGFGGPIFLTKPTAKLAAIVLDDAEKIMHEEFEREYRPKLYEHEHLQKTLPLFRGSEYLEWNTVGDVRFRFRDAGHVFGSAFIEVEERGGVRAVFSGDLGNVNVPILRPTERLPGSDAVFIESTYGNRIHEDERTRKSTLQEAVVKTIGNKGVLIIPAFAIERTQDLLYFLNDLVEKNKIPHVQVFLDSPMAIKVADVMKQFPEYYDQEASKLVMSGDDFLDFPGLKNCMTVDDSKLINESPKPKIIIAGSGMMNGGRILHHLIRYLSDPKTTILIIGYQASGTLGRRIYSGEKSVRIFGEQIPVHATVVSIGAMSAHADQRKLVDWVRGGEAITKKVFCTHGEEAASAALASRIHEELGIPAEVPRFEETIEL